MLSIESKVQFDLICFRCQWNGNSWFSLPEINVHFALWLSARLATLLCHCSAMEILAWGYQIENYNKYWFWVQDVKFGHVFLAILLISNRDRSRYGFLQITCCSRVTYVDNKNIALKADFPFSIRIESNKNLLLHTVESMIVSLWRKMIYFTCVLYHLSEPWNNQPSFVFWSRNI